MTEIKQITGIITSQQRNDHLLARMGYRRMQHRVEPGLYSLGRPVPSSPVLVSSNYSLSFDLLRGSVKGLDCFILVLDTDGVNVWCAAGKGTFGTEELISRIGSTDLASVVSHRRVIVPQLGAPGIVAHEVEQRSGFTVVYGPVRAADLPRFLQEGKATPEMRRVDFPLKDRAVLIPVELVYATPMMLISALILFLVGGAVPALAAVVAVLTGTVLFPLLLPFLPTKDFSSKGLLLGVVAALPFSLYYAASAAPSVGGLLGLVIPPLLIAPIVGYMALNFTGCSTYTSRTGVKKEIFRWIPVMAIMMVAGTLAAVLAAAAGWTGWF
jgi:hypothetical protein